MMIIEGKWGLAAVDIEFSLLINNFFIIFSKILFYIFSLLTGWLRLYVVVGNWYNFILNIIRKRIFRSLYTVVIWAAINVRLFSVHLNNLSSIFYISICTLIKILSYRWPNLFILHRSIIVNCCLTRTHFGLLLRNCTVYI